MIDPSPLTDPTLADRLRDDLDGEQVAGHPATGRQRLIAGVAAIALVSLLNLPLAGFDPRQWHDAIFIIPICGTFGAAIACALSTAAARWPHAKGAILGLPIAILTLLIALCVAGFAMTRGYDVLIFILVGVPLGLAGLAGSLTLLFIRFGRRLVG